MIRAALGESKLSTGLFAGPTSERSTPSCSPGEADRLVLDSAINPALSGTRVLRDGAAGREAQLREWAGWAAEHDADYHLGTTADAVLDTVHRVYAASARRPLTVGRYAVDDTLVPALITTPLTEDTENGELARLCGSSVGQPTVHPPSRPRRWPRRWPAWSTVGLGDHTAQTAILCGDPACPGIRSSTGATSSGTGRRAAVRCRWPAPSALLLLADAPAERPRRGPTKRHAPLSSSRPRRTSTPIFRVHERCTRRSPDRG